MHQRLKHVFSASGNIPEKPVRNKIYPARKLLRQTSPKGKIADNFTAKTCPRIFQQLCQYAACVAAAVIFTCDNAYGVFDPTDAPSFLMCKEVIDNPILPY